MDVRIPEDFAQASPHVVPILRNRCHFAFTDLTIEIQDAQDPARKIWFKNCLPNMPVGEEMALGLSYDKPDARILLNNGHLDAWGLEFDVAMAAAFATLEKTPAPEMTMVAERGYINAQEDGTIGARLMQPAFVNTLDLKGTPVFVCGDSDYLYVTDLDSIDGLTGMFVFIDECLSNSPKPARVLPMVIEGDSVRRLQIMDLPRALSRAGLRLHELRLQFAKERYDDQKKLLEKLFKIKGDERLVVDVSIRTNDDGVSTSRCEWPSVERALLPQTDLVAVPVFSAAAGDEVEEHFVVLGWQVFLDLFGSKLERQEVYPPRYMIREQISDAERTAFRESVLRGKPPR